jgi:putative flippase GtrA
MTKLPIQFIKYLFVGTINFFFGLVVYFICLRLFGFHYILSLIISWALGIVLTYTINFLWVFKPEEKITFASRLIYYAIVYFISLAANIFLLKMVAEKFISDPFYAQLTIIPIIIFINFTGFKYWALKEVSPKNK